LRKIQDHYFKRAKKEKYPARSVYKLEEAQKKYSLLKKGDAVLDLGCQPGSWALYAAQVTGPSGLVVGVDLKTGHPPKRSGCAPIQFLQGSIMFEELLDQVRDIHFPFQVVVSDIAPSTSGNKWVDQQKSLQLSRKVLEIADKMLVDGGNFYCKVFQGEDFPEFVEDVRERFKKVKVVKPKSSRTESREVFVLGMSKREAAEKG
jgi:23S rRNA (uridine2552-2'-O)-methyltransferase